MKIFSSTDYGCGKDHKHYFIFGKEFMRRNGNCFYLFGGRYIGWHDWTFRLSYNSCGYDDGNAEIHISLFGWHSVFVLPWISKKFPYGDCQPPEYGVSVHDNTLWVMMGGKGNLDGGCKWWTWDFPFFTKIHMRTDVLCKDGSWKSHKEVAYKDGVRVPIYESERVNVETYDYKDKYDNSVVPALFWVVEDEWRPKWLTWTGKFKTVRRYIDIEFKGEVGKGKGDWKGGCVGCSYELLDDETPIQCIKRMEREREF